MPATKTWILMLLSCLASRGPAQDPSWALWTIRCGAGGARLWREGAPRSERIPPEPIATRPGRYALHFGRDALGKPESLALDVPPGALVRVACSPGAEGEAFAGDPERAADYVVTVSVAVSTMGGTAGLMARVSGDGGYRFAWDSGRSRFVLERFLGGVRLELGSAPAPPADAGEHRLALQVEGFRLRAWFDDAPILQAFDGAHVRGGWRTWSDTPEAVRFGEVRVEPPAPPRPSCAAATTPGKAVVVAATMAPPGHFGVLELAIDRPHPVVPRSPAGLEPGLLMRPASPIVLRGDPRGLLGHGVFAELPDDGRMTCEVRWPSGSALAGQVAVARIVSVSPGGERLVGRTPSVAITM